MAGREGAPLQGEESLGDVDPRIQELTAALTAAFQTEIAGLESRMDQRHASLENRVTTWIGQASGAVTQLGQQVAANAAQAQGAAGQAAAATQTAQAAGQTAQDT